jgi:hypothetical protein
VRPPSPAPSVCRGCVAGFCIEQAHPDQPPVVKDALGRVSVQLELGDDGGREANPAGVQLGNADRPVGGVTQLLHQPVLLGVSERHRLIVALQRGLARRRGALAGRRVHPILAPADRPERTIDVGFT